MSDPTNEQLLESAQTQYNAGRAADALSLVVQLLERKPDYAEALNLCGLCHFRLQRPAEAEAALRAALRVRPDYSTALNNLGVLLANSRRHADAAEVFARAADLR